MTAQYTANIVNKMFFITTISTKWSCIQLRKYCWNILKNLKTSDEVSHSQVKEKSYHSSFYFWAICGSDVMSQSFWTIRNIVHIRFGESEPLFSSDVTSANRAWALIGLYRFYFSPIGLIWLYFIRLWVSFRILGASDFPALPWTISRIPTNFF